MWWLRWGWSGESHGGNDGGSPLDSSECLVELLVHDRELVMQTPVLLAQSCVLIAKIAALRTRELQQDPITRRRAHTGR